MGLAQALRGGKAALEDFLADQEELYSTDLPYNPAVLELIAETKAEGGGVYLASASHERQVEAVARHLGLFDGVFAYRPRNPRAGEGSLGVSGRVSDPAAGKLALKVPISKIEDFGTRLDYIPFRGDDNRGCSVTVNRRTCFVSGPTFSSLRSSQ